MWIQTYTGNAFDFNDLSSAKFEPVEIATVLSRIPRFAGHSKWFYSVAQHSVLVSRQFIGFTLKLPALLHDAHEVFTGDVTSPLKDYINGSKLAFLEYRIWKWIAGIHGFEPEVIGEIKWEDLRALATEARDLMEKPPKPWIRLPPPWKDRIEPWSSEYAADEWLRFYESLTRKYECHA